MIKQVLSALFTFMVCTAQATITLPALFGNNMVLQQQTDAAIWGMAKKNATVTIITSWDKKKYTVQANASGNWKTTVRTPKASGPYEISLSDGELLKLSNVLIGEVWICSGQSNMEMPVKGFRNQPIIGADDMLLEADDTAIHLFRLERAFNKTKQTDVKAKWETVAPRSVKEFSAVGYNFARILRQRLKVPIGIIQTTWGGTPIEAWMDSLSLQQVEGVKYPAAGATMTKNDPAVLFNAMIAPLVGYNMKGVLWYQGESNRLQPQLYAKLMQGMVNEWRSLWNTGNWPFYYVQIAPYQYPNSRELVPYLREAQDKAQTLISNSGMVVCMDAGDQRTIHPANKLIVSKRLAYWALANTYDREGIVYQGPVYKSMKIVADTAKIAFNNAPNGLTTYGKDLVNFEVAGSDKVFYPANAKITNEGIYLFSPQVKGPAAVRYAFKDWPEGELFNTDGLPAAPFRTDDWEPVK
ncbi:sialate O-acetylesterase [Paraflavitalea speifideaquila]|uniref:sialate O-acetylesterase n=1 Tax=Paraflavitalea speifideaquila TaxID=3076558 RepID=UPI0028E8F971|nr:sialate O-acetylesterase [Paraflavitalea speifideiaquila]